jgi:hypothetical protein
MWGICKYVDINPGMKYELQGDSTSSTLAAYDLALEMKELLVLNLNLAYNVQPADAPAAPVECDRAPQKAQERLRRNQARQADAHVTSNKARADQGRRRPRF